MDHAVLAQAAPIVVDNGVAFALPLVLLLLGGAGAFAQSLWRVTQLEQRQSRLEERQDRTEREHGETKEELGTAVAIMGRLEAHLTEMRSEVRDALRKAS